jgi:hypothetical protein
VKKRDVVPVQADAPAKAVTKKRISKNG